MSAFGPMVDHSVRSACSGAIYADGYDTTGVAAANWTDNDGTDSDGVDTGAADSDSDDSDGGDDTD